MVGHIAVWCAYSARLLRPVALSMRRSALPVCVPDQRAQADGTKHESPDNRRPDADYVLHVRELHGLFGAALSKHRETPHARKARRGGGTEAMTTIDANALVLRYLRRLDDAAAAESLPHTYRNELVGDVRARLQTALQSSPDDPRATRAVLGEIGPPEAVVAAVANRYAQDPLEPRISRARSRRGPVFRLVGRRSGLRGGYRARYSSPQVDSSVRWAPVRGVHGRDGDLHGLGGRRGARHPRHPMRSIRCGGLTVLRPKTNPTYGFVSLSLRVMRCPA